MTEPNDQKPSEEALRLAKIIDDGHKMVKDTVSGATDTVKGLFNTAMGAIDGAIGKPFRLCIAYDEETRCTEIVLEDVAIVWEAKKGYDLGYSMDDGRLVAVRISGDIRHQEP